MAAASSSASVSATAAPAVPAAQPKPDQKTVPASVAATPIASAAATPVKSAPQEPQAPATPASTSSILKPDDFPVLEKGKEKVVPPTAPKAMAATPKKGPSTAATSATEPLAATKAVKQKPVKLSLATPAPASVPVPVPAPALTQASTPAVEKAPVTIDVAPKSVINAAAFPALPPSTAASPVVSSPAIRTAPKTLRVVPAAKVEAAAAPVVSLPLSAAALPSPSLSKQPSIVSLSRTDRPSTPASELISDNASLTSASLSRPSSPPPTRVGSAPVRTKTKSQLKKERKEAGKEKVISEAESSSAKPEPEVEIAPIMGRKKKQKKEKPASSKTSTSTPAISRAASPSPAPEAKEVEKPPVEKAVEVISTKQNKEVEPEAKIGKTSDPKSKGKGKTAEAPSPVEPPATPELPEEPAEKPLPTPQQVLSELMAEALVPDVNKLAFVRPPVITVPRVDLTTGDLQPMEAKLEITDEDREALNAGRPVRKLEPKGATRVMLTPNGDCVRNLTPAEEERYLELQRTILEEYGPASFVPSRHNATTGFTLIQGRAVPNGPPAFFPLVDTNGSVMDPVSKIQRDEALSYINQFVLPSLSTNPQLERALNANVIDADMLSGARSGAQQWWKPAPTTGGDHSVGQLDPLENLTAAAAARAGTAVNTGVTVANGGAAPGQPAPLGNVTLLSLQDSEVAMQAAKKETEKIERALNQLLKKNRRLLLGATGGH
jgi:CCR4-NOT transcription complex subunit 4